MRCVAVPVFESDNSLAGGISLSGPSSRFTTQKLRELRDCALEAAGRLSRNWAAAQSCQVERSQAVRCWHKADSDRSLAMSAVGGKADVVRWLRQRLLLTRWTSGGHSPTMLPTTRLACMWLCLPSEGVPSMPACRNASPSCCTPAARAWTSAAGNRIGKSLSVAADRLESRAYLIGDRFTVADIYLTGALLLVGKPLQATLTGDELHSTSLTPQPRWLVESSACGTKCI